MTTERVVRIFAGAMILVSIALTIYHSQWWLLLTGFVGLNLMQSGFTKFCPLDSILRMMGLPSCGGSGKTAGT
jgi:disulfide bond formation protein DsbB